MEGFANCVKNAICSVNIHIFFFFISLTTNLIRIHCYI